MSFGQPTIPPSVSSHTPSDTHIPSGTSEINLLPSNSPPISEQSADGNSHSPRQEEHLESHEVIELQAFSERKVWIEDKIKFLESLPPIEVFVGLDALRSSAQEVPGLPTRAQLHEWLQEHDRIEKETEIFDSGDLRKLRQLTKEATQRHLSPADTDLIEITLTTIYTLDKLLHLLRDRSENLDLLGIRLLWEEQRIGAWVDYRKIMADIQTFLTSKGRWSPNTYDLLPKTEDGLRRRGSMASLTSMASDTSAASSGSLSRGARFKLAELLARDAAQLSGRISSLRHGKISAAGKALDKLIDNSRKPVPDELLDEQDRLEEKGINDLEDVGAFVMDIVTQWRKADEVYMETRKDLSAAQNLLEEIEIAKLHHPVFSQSNAYLSRADTLCKRVTMRSAQTSSRGGFPFPLHPAFQDQSTSNSTLISLLSEEISQAMDLTRKVQSAAEEYHAAADAVKTVDALGRSSTELVGALYAIADRLQNGVSAGEDDGSPPDLNFEDCIQPTKHAAFLTLLPSLLQELEKTLDKAQSLTGTYRFAIVALGCHRINESFTTTANNQAETLVSACHHIRAIRDSVNARVARLRTARSIWATMNKTMADLEVLRGEVGDAMESGRWRQQTARDIQTKPLTPESPDARPLTTLTVPQFAQRADTLQAILDDVPRLMDSFSGTLEQPLNDLLTQTLNGLRNHLDSIKQMIALYEAILRQGASMTVLRDESNDLQLRLEEVKIRYDTAVEDVLEDKVAGDETAELQANLEASMVEVQTAAQDFIDNIHRRTLFVSRDSPAHRAESPTYVRKKFSASNIQIGVSGWGDRRAVELPFSLSSLDDAVRSDSNSWAMQLAGQLDAVSAQSEHLRLVRRAKEVDGLLRSARNDLRNTSQELSSIDASYSSGTAQDGKLDALNVIMAELDSHTQKHRSRLSRSLSIVRERLREMDSAAGSDEALTGIVATRHRALEDLESRFSAWNGDVETLRTNILDALDAETRRIELVCLEAKRVAEAKRLEEERIVKEQRERERLAAEEQAAKQQEQERLAEEERKKKELAVEEEAAREREEQRLAAEEREREMLAAEERAANEREMERLKANDTSDAPEDVFGLTIARATTPSTSGDGVLQNIVVLRQRLRSLGINELARPHASRSNSFHLPSQEEYEKLQQGFDNLCGDVSVLSSPAQGSPAYTELRSLKLEIDASAELLDKLHSLASLSHAIQFCDAACSDLLEHIDSYPSLPLAEDLATDHVSSADLTSSEQLKERLTFTKSAVKEVVRCFAPVKDDARAEAELDRAIQTWTEMEEMARDLVSVKKSQPPSRPPSDMSSAKNSTSSISTPHSDNHAKKQSYSSLNPNGSSAKGRYLTPNLPSSRQMTSGGPQLNSRSASRMSTISSSSNRSVSGPIIPPSPSSSSIYSSTFASRQRTTSLSSTTSSAPALAKQSARARAKSRASLGGNEPHPKSRLGGNEVTMGPRTGARQRSSSSMSSWARAPRQSFPTARMTTPPPPKREPKKPYVANPKNKLDMAVGDVVNNLPVNINVEVVADTWKDQSGKYWIGEEDPKLCFCRILRSQTVMVRVGGGWQELSKFIRSHFADLFRFMPLESPTTVGSPNSKFGSREEKWISSATLRESEAEDQLSPPMAPKTPEPSGSFVPSFVLSTPSGQSSRSIKSSPSGSPLAPLQFMRRADPEGHPQRPMTPSKPATSRPRSSLSGAPSRNVWRP